MKVKTCKGNYRVDKFDGCGKTSFKFTYGLCPSCLYEWMTTTENGKIHHAKSFLKQVSKLSNKIVKEKNKEEREAMKSIARLIQEARVPFQKWIRLRDINDGCISCDSLNVKLWHGGHYFKAEIYRGLIFHLINVNKQCEKCNTFLGGNETGYRLGLVSKYGEDVVKELESIADENRTHDYTREEIKSIKKEYQSKLKQL
jgi:hypothetical protein